jgi:hypothetical protein
VEIDELIQAWQDTTLRTYLWDIAGSFAHHAECYQAELYRCAWCWISWGNLHYDTASLMDYGYWIMAKRADRMHLTERWHLCHDPPPRKMAKRRLRFILKRGGRRCANVLS